MLDIIIESGIEEDEIDAIVDDALDSEDVELPPEEEDGIFADIPPGIEYDKEEEYEDPYIVYDVEEEEEDPAEEEYPEEDEDFFVTEANLLKGK